MFVIVGCLENVKTEHVLKTLIIWFHCKSYSVGTSSLRTVPRHRNCINAYLKYDIIYLITLITNKIFVTFSKFPLVTVIEIFLKYLKDYVF